MSSWFIFLKQEICSSDLHYKLLLELAKLSTTLYKIKVGWFFGV